MAATRIRLGKQLQLSSSPGSILYTDTNNELTFLAPPGGADKLIFYDDSATAIAWLTLGTGLSITGTTINASGASGYDTIQEEGSDLTQRTKLNFVGAGFTAADDSGNSRTNVSLDDTLNALAAYNTNGLLTQTAADTFTGRTITGTSNRIDVTNGSGVAGNPTIDISATYVGQSSITTLGTIATGVWHGTAVAAAYGGTDQTTVSQGDLLVGTTGTAWTKLTIGTNGYVLQSNGTTAGWVQLDSSDLSDVSNIAFLNANQTFTGDNVFDENITMNSTPTNSTHLITLGFLTNALAGRNQKVYARVTTDANISDLAAGAPDTVDDITLSVNDRVLVNGQTDQSENGIYVVDTVGTGSNGSWSRSTDADNWEEFVSAWIWVSEGTVYEDTNWYCPVDTGGILDTDDILFSQIDGAASITAGTGLTKTGNVINIETASSARIVVNADNIDLATTAVSPGSYGSATQVGTFTVDAYGRLTAASNSSISIASTAISDFTEAVQDVVGNASFLLGSGGTSVSYDDGANTLTISSTNIFNANGTITAGDNRTATFGNSSTTLTFIDSVAVDLLSLSEGRVGLVDGVAYFDVNTATFSTPGGTIEVNSTGLVFDIGGASGALITDLRVTPTGFEYDDDYSATYTDRSLVDKQYVDNAVIGVTFDNNRYFVEGSTATTIDVTAGDGSVTDIDGNTATTTLPSNHNLIRVLRNGIQINETGSMTTRDYSVNHSTGVITLASALTASEILLIEIMTA